LPEWLKESGRLSVSNPEQTASPGKTTEGDTDVDREVRFAVVMYGGVSLAIYINGVAQELLDMVRSTATVPSEDTRDKEDKKWEPLVKDALPGAMGVYRKLGQYLGIADEQERLNRFRQQSISNTDAIRTRLIVDIISGTSAGGINGVFLAKALARDQGMTGLKQLWLSEGDLGKLLNDKRSMKGVRGFDLKPQESLLNSQRMYYKLLEALDRMDEAKNKRAETEDSPLVRELDLFITTTDLDGIPLPIGLFDKVVYERRYKNVFHFRYATEAATGIYRDDFKKQHDPFLAFAARCTSSFPFAFSPMRLCDITDVAKAYNADPPYADQSATTPEWDRFFSDYMRNGLFDLDLAARQKPTTGELPGTGTTEEKLAAAKIELRESFRKRSFGDGGYLDNKPFSYATSMLTRRQADCAVDRKLLYVEPSPQHPELNRQRADPPDFAENVRAAVLDLPREETIREDIDRVYERNALLQRVSILAKEVDADIQIKKIKPLTHEEFTEKGLNEMIEQYGVTYGAYHRLKVAEITRLLSELIARAAGHDPSSDATVAIRELVSAWRRAFYHPLTPAQRKSADRKDPNGEDKKTENEFLLEFDIQYDLRRHAFLNRRINQLSKLDEDARGLLSAASESDKWPTTVNVEIVVVDPQREEFQTELNRLKKDEVAPALRNARSAGEKLLNRNSDIGEKFYRAIGELQIGWPDLEEILNCDAGAARETKAQKILEDCNRNSALSELAKIIAAGFGERRTSHENRPASSAAGTLAARVCIDHYRRNFVLYDLVTYPVQYGTGAGEASVVDVFRVSPEDAEMLMKEPAEKSEGAKLAGRSLMSFGAFLDESWRRNDMLWGRLDGAERIISALLANKEDEELRKELIKEAHRGIITQEINEKNTDAVCRLLSNALAHRHTQEDRGNELIAFVDSLRDRFSPTQGESLDAAQKLHRDQPPRRSLEYISRSTNIAGNMIYGLADKYRFGPARRFGARMASLGTVLWNLVAVAVPESLPSLFFRHWLRLLYFFAFALIAVGIFVNNNVKFAGWQVLGIIVVIHLVVSGMESYIRGGRFLKLLKAAAIFVVLTLVLLGVLSLVERYGRVSLSWPIELAVAGGIALVGSFLLSRARRDSTR
jgi:patatin-related protein